MNVVSRTVTGIVMIILGAGLIGLSFLSLIFLVYGLIVLILGIVIFFNKKEDKIEQIIERRKK